MSKVSVEYTTGALYLRELLNIGHVVLLPVCVFLIARFVRIEWVRYTYSKLTKPVKGLIGLGVFFSSDMIRATTIWIILHSFGTTGTYLTDIVPLLIALTFGTIGLLCFIRNFTPEYGPQGEPLWWGGHRLWIGCLAAYIAVAVFNWTIL
jgi:hypothetical protein